MKAHVYAAVVISCVALGFGISAFAIALVCLLGAR